MRPTIIHQKPSNEIMDRIEFMENEKQKELRLSSERFGEITYTSDAIMRFKYGLTGFEDLQDFVIVDISGCEPFQWLIAINSPTIGFPVLPAQAVNADYEIQMREESELMYGMDAERLLVYIIATLPTNLQESTLNLRAPVLIDAHENTGQQIILMSDEYSAEYPLFQNEDTPERDESCSY